MEIDFILVFIYYLVSNSKGLLFKVIKLHKNVAGVTTYLILSDLLIYGIDITLSELCLNKNEVFNKISSEGKLLSLLF